MRLVSGMVESIHVIDSVFNQEHFCLIQEKLAQNKWGLHFSDENNQRYKLLWQMILDDDSFFTDTLFNCIKQHIGQNYILERVYANGQTCNQNGVPHVDHYQPDRYTFLLYANPEWDILWDGATIFIDRKWDTCKQEWITNSLETVSYIPKPNRGLLFPSNQVHFANGPTRDFYGVRHTVAWKLCKVGTEQFDERIDGETIDVRKGKQTKTIKRAKKTV